MSTQPIVPFTLDDYFQTTGIGSINKAISRNYYGINHRQTPNAVQMSKDQYGMTFFVRPQLNMQADNLRNYRQMYSLLTADELSLQRFVRCTLDPRLMYGYQVDSASRPYDKLNCPFVDPLQAFIPILSNDLTNLSGWPDLVAPTFTSKEGNYKEVYSQIDGTVEQYQEFDLTATFRNTRGDPILFLFYIWLKYSSLVFEGLLVPYPDMILENEIDYMTRIYRLVLDHNKVYVKKIAATGVSFPTAVPMGAYFDFNSERPFNEGINEVSLRFTCIGAQYQDDILIEEFNKTVEIFNPNMIASNRSKYMRKVDFDLLPLFNNQGYAHIDKNTYELEWYVPLSLYVAKLQALTQLAPTQLSQEQIRILERAQFGGVVIA